MVNKKGFTLIELIAVLVIMAIIALIATPLVMNIIRKVRISADKRSIDAYGRSIELAIAGYLMDNGSFPTSIEQLTIEYSGDEVVCETTQINPDSSVYLSNCKVNNREVTNYTYGNDSTPSYEAYSVGDEVTYNGVDYYVLKDSGAKDNVVTLLKATPFTVYEVNTYGGVGTENNHVNRYTSSSQGTAYDINGYGGMAYYNSETCGYNGNEWVESGCTADYEQSEVKYAVDNWAKSNTNVSLLSEARLINSDDLEQLGFEYGRIMVGPPEGIPGYPVNSNVPSWVYEYTYWTMSAYRDDNNVSTSSVFGVESNGVSRFSVGTASCYDTLVRPVVELYKNDGITRKNSGNN